MKHLFLLRHAKSDWGTPGQPDFERTLNDRGRRAAPLVGRELARRRARPDLALVSPAARTRETISLVLAAAGLEPDITYDERIYEATAGRLLEVLTEADGAHESVLLVGHNPGLENLLAHFTSDRREMPTAALAALSLDARSWSDVAACGATLDWFVKARDLDARAER